MALNDLDAAFKEFHADHPEVYGHFKGFADEVIARGHRSYSARAIFYRVRWLVDIEQGNGSRFKINDHHSPYYARMWLGENPHHAGFFELRKIKEEKGLV